MKSKFKFGVLIFVGTFSMFSAGCFTTQEEPGDGPAKALEGTSETAPPTTAVPKLSADRAHLVGREMADLFASKEKIVDNEKVSLYVNRVGQYVSYHLDTGPKNMKCVGGGEKILPMNGFRFGVIQSANKEVVALPGGFIFISTGLLADMKTEDQLAGALAHAATNVVCQHGITRIHKVLDTVPREQQAAAYEKIWKAGLPIRFQKVADRGAMMALFRAGYFPEDYVQFVEKMGSPDATERVTWMKKDLSKMQESGVTDTKKSRNARFLDFKRMAGA